MPRRSHFVWRAKIFFEEPILHSPFSGGRSYISERGHTIICLQKNGELKMENVESGVRLMCRESTTLRQRAPSDASTAWRPHEIRLKHLELVKKTVSEGQAQAKLQPAHRAGRVNHAKSGGGRARRNGGARRSEVHNVER